MAIRCDDCRYLFPTKRTSCPHCGGRVYRDLTPDSELLVAGYLMAPSPRNRNSSSVNAESTAFTDPYEAIRESYFREHNQHNNVGNTVGSSNAARPSESQPPQHETSNPLHETDFFSQFDTPQKEIESIPVVESKPYTAKNLDDTPSDPYAEERKALERQRRRIDRRYRAASVLTILSRIRWDILIRLFAIILLIATLVGIWNMRYAILEFILHLIFSLLPIVFVLAILGYILRALFKNLF